MENSTNKKTIKFNTSVLNWYLNEDKVKQIHDDKYREKIYSLFTNAAYEDPLVFMRIVLYIANTRTKDDEIIGYKSLLHFLGILLPQFVLNNIDLILKLGNKNDVLYFLSIPNIQKRIIKFIEYKSKYDSDYKDLLNGNVIKTKINRVIKYNKENNVVTLLQNILDDPNFNGINV